MEIQGLWEMIVFSMTCYLIVSGAWSKDAGTNQSISETSNATHDYNTIQNRIVTRDVSIILGSDTNLTCSSKTWSDLIFTIWEIKLKNKECSIGFNAGGDARDSCQDGKALRNSSIGESYLFIPNSSISDEGVYSCESVYKGGMNRIRFNVYVPVSPDVSAWLEWQDNRWLAVCLAERGNPAAVISWQNSGNASLNMSTSSNSDGSYNVRSVLKFPENATIGNLACTVNNQTVTPKYRDALTVPVSVGITCFIMAMLGILYIAKSNLIITRGCCKPTKTTCCESKPPLTEDVEEVEPYASYVQRVNSIYN